MATQTRVATIDDVIVTFLIDDVAMEMFSVQVDNPSSRTVIINLYDGSGNNIWTLTTTTSYPATTLPPGSRPPVMTHVNRSGNTVFQFPYDLSVSGDPNQGLRAVQSA